MRDLGLRLLGVPVGMVLRYFFKVR